MIAFLEDKLKNSKSLEEVLPEDVINIINNKIESEINNYINKRLQNYQVEEVIKNIIIKNENTYNAFMDKSLKEIVSEKSLLNIQKSLKTDKFMNIVLLQIKEQINEYLQGYLKEEFNEEKRFDELFNGIEDDTVDKIRNILLELKNQNKIIIVTSHIKEDIDILSDEVYKFNNGNVERIK